jgi:uncharacterized membrane protein YfcA
MTIVDAGLALLAILAGAVAAISGFGIGSLLTPALSIALGTKAAVAIVAVPHVAATALRLWGLREAVDRAVLRRFGLASAAGGLVGAILHAAVASPGLSVLLGVLLVFVGASELSGFGRRLRFPGGWSIVAGVLSGTFGGLVGNQGGIRSGALLRFDLAPTALVATATASALLVDAARLPVYVATSGPDMAAAAPTIALLTAGVLIGTVGGAPILRRLPPTVFRPLLAGLLILLGLSLIAGVGR